MHFNQYSHLALRGAKMTTDWFIYHFDGWKSQIIHKHTPNKYKKYKMAPRKENRSERRRIATEREKKRIEAFNQQVERIRELVCPEMSCPTKSKILRAAVDRLNYLESLAEKLSSMDQNYETQNFETSKETAFENENSSGYNSDEAPVNYSQQCELSNDAFPQEFYNPYYQETNISPEQYQATVEQHQATDYLQADYQSITANAVELNLESKQESYDNFFRQFLQE